MGHRRRPGARAAPGYFKASLLREPMWTLDRRRLDAGVKSIICLRADDQLPYYDPLETDSYFLLPAAGLGCTCPCPRTSAAADS